MDKRKSVLNVAVSISFKFVLLIGTLLVRRFLIKYIGNDINGLNSLYLSIVGFLSVAELGVGGAITFCMYKPIVEGQKEKVAALYQLFRKIYLLVGAVIFVLGIAVIPLLPMLAKDYTAINVNLAFTFLLMLISVVVSYMFSSKISLINAYKDNYITTTINSVGLLLQYVSQIAVVILTQSFSWYLVCRIVSVCVQWAATEIVTARRHGDILAIKQQKLDDETKLDVSKKIKAMFMHKIGAALVNSADSLIISAFIGVAILGVYSNYITVVTGMTSVIMLVFTPLTSVVGHMFVSDKKAAEKYHQSFHSLNFAVGVIFFLGYYAVIDNFVAFVFGEGLALSRNVSFVITFNYFVQFMRQSTILFRNASGTFYNDRWKPVIEGVLNAALSIALIFVFTEWKGDELGIVGVIVATIITNLTICHIVEPYVLYKHAFGTSAKRYFTINYIYISIFAVAMFLLDICMVSVDVMWQEFLANGFISIGISTVIIAVTLVINKSFRHHCVSAVRKLTHKK